MRETVTCPNCGHTFHTSWVRWGDEENVGEEYKESYLDECPDCGCEFITWCTYQLVATDTEVVE